MITYASGSEDGSIKEDPKICFKPGGGLVNKPRVSTIYQIARDDEG